jgi:hypothetical protein
VIRDVRAKRYFEKPSKQNAVRTRSSTSTTCSVFVTPRCSAK